MLLAHRPAQSLASFVQLLWYCEEYPANHRRERVLPSGKFQLVIDLSERAAPPLVVGMRSEYSVIETAGLKCMMGVVFTPGGVRPFIDLPADEFYNRVIPLDLIWGSAATSLRDRLREAETPSGKFQVLETALLNRAERGIELHTAVQYALGEFQSAPHVRSVLDVALESGLSRRRFTQLFREQVGLTPKLYCRLRRFQNVVRQIVVEEVDWADVALSGGYFDQAHMAHEFRAFAGISPGVWLSGERPFMNHAVME